MDNDADALGFAEDPEFSLDPVAKELVVWIDEDERMVGMRFGDGSPRLLSPARAREMAVGLERGARNTKFAKKAEREVALLRRAADRAEDLQ